MANVYEKTGFQNPSIPKPSGGYSSLIKPATAPMRQGGLSQLAAKAAAAGRQPAAGNPPIPDTGRGVFQPRAQESQPQGTGRQQLGSMPSTGYSGQQGMLGQVSQRAATPQGQQRGPGGPPPGYVAGGDSRVPGGGDSPQRQAPDAGRMPYSEPSYEAAPISPQARQEMGMLEMLVRGSAAPGYAEGYDPRGSYVLTPEQLEQKKLLEAMAGGAGSPTGEGAHQSKKSEAIYDLIQGGMDPQLAELVGGLLHDEYGISDEEIAKQVNEAAARQAEMMAARGLGASGLAGTGFGDVYSQVHSDAAQLAIQDELAKKQLAGQLMTGSQELDMKQQLMAAQQSADALANPKLGQWSVLAGGNKINPKAEATYQKLLAEGYTEDEIKAMGWVDDKTDEYNIANPLPDNLIELEGPPPLDDVTAFWAWAQAIKSKYGTNHVTIKEWLEANNIDYPKSKDVPEYM